MRVALGSDRLFDSGMLRGRRVGVVANPASVDGSFRHLVDRAAAAPSVTLAAVFGPQHGFRADLQDNMVESPHARDGRRRVMVYSLYSETREPTAEMLSGLDALVIDLQDVGARIYTFVHTMANCLRAAARHRVPVIVCDRPNPIGGAAIEGPMLVEGYESFVGLFPIPMRHGMTIGELARLFNERFGIGAELEVVPLEGWRRDMYWDETGLPWVLPSPNMPTLDTAVVYPGGVLFEGTQLSEGRGTTRPFELLGAPWIRADELAQHLRDRQIPGVELEPAAFVPTSSIFAGQSCNGLRIVLKDRSSLDSVGLGVEIRCALQRLYPGVFQLDPALHMVGSRTVLQAIKEGQEPQSIAAAWQPPLDEFRRLRAAYLLYPD